MSAQEPTSSPNTKPDPEITAIEKAKVLAQRRKEIAEFERDEAAARHTMETAGIPTATVTALQGTITPDDKFGYVAHLLAYQAVKACAHEIGEEISRKLTVFPQKPRILMVDDLDVAADDVPLRTVDSQLTRLAGWLDRQHGENQALLDAQAALLATPPAATPGGPKGVAEPVAPAGIAGPAGAALPGAAAALVAPANIFGMLGGVGTAVTGVTGIANALTNLAGIFRRNYNIYGQTITVDKDALKAAVARELTEYETLLEGFYPLGDSQLIQRAADCVQSLWELTRQKTLLKSEVEDANTARQQEAQSRLSELKTKLAAVPAEDAAQRATLLTTMDEIERTIAAAKSAVAAAQTAQAATTALSTEADTFLTALVATSASQPKALLTLAVERELVATLSISHLLCVRLHSAGGEAITEQSLLASGVTNYLGGGAASYVLADKAGRILAAGAPVRLFGFTYRLTEKQTRLSEIPIT